MEDKRRCLRGFSGALEYASIDVRANRLPFGHSVVYTFTQAKHPYFPERICLTMCADIDAVRSRYCSCAKFLRTHLRSGRQLTIYFSRSGCGLRSNLIYLDFISDILGEKIQKDIEARKDVYRAQLAEKLLIGDKIAVDDTATGDDADYY